MMNRGRAGSVGVLVAGLAIMTVLAGGCGPRDAKGGQAGELAGAESTATGRVVNVAVLEVQPERYADFVTVTGAVTADRDVTVASEESGVIREVFVAKGARVRASQPIARIDDRVLRAQYEQATAEAELARETWERQRRLWEEDSIGSEIAYLRARYGAETAAATARVLAVRLERTTILAPIAGVLDERFVEVGSMVAPGSAVARVVDADPLKVNAGIPERYAGEVRTGAAVVVSFDNGAEVEGVVGYASTMIDDRNRTFAVEVRVGNAGGQLKPGMVARVRVTRAIIEDALLVPRDAVLRAQSGYVVYTAAQENGQWVARTRAVETGSSDGRRVMIREGLSAGERIIISGQQQVANGDAIRITEGGPGGGP